MCNVGVASADCVQNATLKRFLKKWLSVKNFQVIQLILSIGFHQESFFLNTVHVKNFNEIRRISFGFYYFVSTKNGCLHIF